MARYRAPGAVEAALLEVQGFWNDLLSSVRVESPLPGLDLMLNGWLAYQTLGCRIWGRSAFYQSGGAFGFRDQLQDAAALFALRPAITRAQILLHAAHQFVEGDVLHWWHPPASRGTRTRFSDDLLWLPYLTAGYVTASGDLALLDERAGFRCARLLAPGEDEAYLETTAAAASATVYEHCCLALDRSLAVGAHGLPLMGTGDWNDAMNRVGREGRGESVWVGFFLFAMLDDWAQLCAQRGDHTRARRYGEARRRLGTALDGAAWDGAWYRRAWYDDGAVLGSAANDECRIDALAQAWAVISGAASPERAAASLDAAEAHLVSPDDGMIRLLTPPFDRTPHDPGYIKGYLPGIRENGGQYTHAALWLVRAEAEAGRRAHAADFLDMLTPVWHGGSAERAATYQVEPYVVAADLYGVAPHVGRGGWTWYTGSSGWMLRVALESLLGFTLEGGHTLVLRPRIPDYLAGIPPRLARARRRRHPLRDRGAQSPGLRRARRRRQPGRRAGRDPQWRGEAAARARRPHASGRGVALLGVPSLVGREIERFEPADPVERQAVVACAAEEEALVARRGLAAFGAMRRLVGESRDPLPVTGHHLHRQSTVHTVLYALGAVEPFGVVGSQLVGQSPDERAGVGGEVRDGPLARSHREVEDEAVAVDPADATPQGTHLSTVDEGSRIQVAAVGEVPEHAVPRSGRDLESTSGVQRSGAQAVRARPSPSKKCSCAGSMRRCAGWPRSSFGMPSMRATSRTAPSPVASPARR